MATPDNRNSVGHYVTSVLASVIQKSDYSTTSPFDLGLPSKGKFPRVSSAPPSITPMIQGKCMVIALPVTQVIFTDMCNY